MPDYAIYDGATGQPSSSVLAPGERLARPATQLNPAEESYEVGESPSTGPTAPNVIAAPGPFSKSKGL